MIVDPLYILLTMEAIVVLSALLVLMARRGKVQTPAAPSPDPPATPPSEPQAAASPEPPAEAVPDSDVIRRSLVLGMLQENIKEIQKHVNLDEGEDKAESQGLLLDQVYNLNMDLLKNLSEALQQEEGTPVESLSEALTVKFRVSINDRLLSFMRFLEKQPEAAPEGEPEAETEEP